MAEASMSQWSPVAAARAAAATTCLRDKEGREEGCTAAVDGGDGHGHGGQRGGRRLLRAAKKSDEWTTLGCAQNEQTKSSEGKER